MIRSVVTLSALGLALAGCTTGEATNQAPHPAVAPAAPVQQQTPAVQQNSQPQQQTQQQAPQMQQMVDDMQAQQKRNLEQINKQLPANVPQVPTVMPGEAGYDQQMDAYRQQVNEYMCAEGNAYTIPSNQRSC